MSGKLVGQVSLKLYHQWYKSNSQPVPRASVPGPMLFITLINNLPDGRDYTLSKFENGTTLGGVIDMLKRRAVIQRNSAVQRNELTGAPSLAWRSLTMLASTSRLGSSSAAKALGSQWAAKEDVSAEDLAADCDLGYLHQGAGRQSGKMILSLSSVLTRSHLDIAYNFGFPSTRKIWMYRNAEEYC